MSPVNWLLSFLRDPTLVKKAYIGLGAAFAFNFPKFARECLKLIPEATAIPWKAKASWDVARTNAKISALKAQHRLLALKDKDSRPSSEDRQIVELSSGLQEKRLLSARSGQEPQREVTDGVDNGRVP
jgi:hypothetical protein